MENAGSVFYREEISPILPPEVLDFHTHTWVSENWKFKPWETEKDGGKYMVTEENYPPERLLSDGQKCFPDKSYKAVVFGYPTPAADLDKDRLYVAAAAEAHRNLYPLVLAGKVLNIPKDQIRKQLRSGGFWGYKVFLNWLGDGYADIGIEDMISENEMSLAQELRLIVMLHVPRAGRLADPEIQQGVQHLSKEYPNAQIVLAHCGRCYLPSEMTRAIDSIKHLANVSMDTSMVMDPLAVQIAMETIGPERLLYASDFPVAAMKGRRVRVMDHWVDVVLDEYPESAYRAQSSSIRATYMAVEIAVAIRDAAERVGISDSQRDGIFHDNGMKLLHQVTRQNA
jgi:uncharacterized protein